jgi:hypothetical protein
MLTPCLFSFNGLIWNFNYKRNTWCCRLDYVLSKSQVLNSPVLQDVTLFGNRVQKEIIKVSENLDTDIDKPRRKNISSRYPSTN